MNATANRVQQAEQPRQHPVKLELDAVKKIRVNEYLIRFGFGAAISIVAGIIVKLAGPVFGGMFLAFPAILPAALTLLEKKEGTAQAVSDVRGAIIGGLALLIFAIVAASLLNVSAGLALVLALLAWMVTGGALYLVSRAAVKALGEKQYLPEIPTTDAAAVLESARRRKLTLSAAESCTGGLLSALFTSVPKASEVFLGGVVSYANETKEHLLEVDGKILAGEGAISERAAREMADSVRKKTGASLGLAVTGNAGGASDGEPPGTAYIAVGDSRRCEVRKLQEDHGPGRNQEFQIMKLLSLAREFIEGE